MAEEAVELLENEDQFVEGIIEGLESDLGGVAGSNEAVGLIKRRVRSRVRKNYRRRVRPSAKRMSKRSYSRGKKSVTAATSLTKGVTTKGYFEFMKGQLPQEIQSGLASGNLQFVDASIYVVKNAAGISNVKMFSASDDNITGVSNLNDAKLPKGSFFLLTGISVLYGERQNLEDVTSVKCNVDYPVCLANGEIKKIIAGDEILMKDFPIANFPENPVDGNGRKNFVALENPKWIKEQVVLETEIEMPSAGINDATVDAEKFATIKLIFHGGMIMKK